MKKEVKKKIDKKLSKNFFGQDHNPRSPCVYTHQIGKLKIRYSMSEFDRFWKIQLTQRALVVSDFKMLDKIPKKKFLWV